MSAKRLQWSFIQGTECPGWVASRGGTLSKPYALSCGLDCARLNPNSSSGVVPACTPLEQGEPTPSFHHSMPQLGKTVRGGTGFLISGANTQTTVPQDRPIRGKCVSQTRCDSNRLYRC